MNSCFDEKYDTFSLHRKMKTYNFIHSYIVHVYTYTQTVGEYYRREKRYLDVPPLNVSMADFVAPVCYDAMWSLALAINSTITGTCTASVQYEFKPLPYPTLHVPHLTLPYTIPFIP